MLQHGATRVEVADQFRVPKWISYKKTKPSHLLPITRRHWSLDLSINGKMTTQSSRRTFTKTCTNTTTKHLKEQWHMQIGPKSVFFIHGHQVEVFNDESLVRIWIEPYQETDPFEVCMPRTYNQ